jgi:hypothetical protein
LQWASVTKGRGVTTRDYWILRVTGCYGPATSGAIWSDLARCVLIWWDFWRGTMAARGRLTSQWAEWREGVYPPFEPSHRPKPHFAEGF